jgi:hypothetical protein
VLMATEKEALAFGRQDVEVRVLENAAIEAVINEEDEGMRIRITGASKSTYWYANKIGEVFEAVLFDEYYVKDCRDGTEDAGYVDVNDCVIIAEEAEELANVTVIKDEALGGLLREYREVKRKAAVGARIKIVAAENTFGNYANGDVKEITWKDSDGDVFFTSNKNSGDFFAHAKEYVVLEPTDIVRIGNVRYRIVERKANVGERVVAIRNSVNVYDVGHVGIVASDGFVDFNGQGNPYVAGNGRWACGHERSYRVLEPVASAAQAPTPAAEDADLLVLSRRINELFAKLDAQETQISGLTDAVGKLTLQLRVAREDIVLIAEGVSEDIERLERKAGVGQYEPRLTRDDVVAKAKRDVAELERTYRSTVRGAAVSFWPEECAKDGFSPVHYVDYVIDREKRTVVALIRYISNKAVAYRGIAKCAPGDVFNSHIGRAIALRRALGLDVPTEYTKAPQPTEPRVGDIVKILRYYGAGKLGRVTAVRPKNFGDWDRGLTLDSDGDFHWAYIDAVQVIDDSREGVAE